MERARAGSLGQVDLAKNKFVGLLNRETRGAGVVFPPSREIDRLRERTRQGLEKAAKRVKAQTAELGGAEEMQEKIRALEQQLTQISQSLKGAFPIERQGVAPLKRRLRGEINKVKDDLEKRRKATRVIDRAAERTQKSTTADTLRKKFDNLLSDFPEAQLLDLSVLNHFKNEQGLPAVTFFSLRSLKSCIEVVPYPFSPVSKISTGNGVIDQPEIDDKLHTVLMRNLREQIQEATGVGLSDRSLWALKILLKTNFPTGQVIPAQAKEIIRKARSSKKFKWVGLLAEVKKWQVEYHDLYGADKPWISGTIVNKPKTDDPLIVASAMIGNRQYWFVLGAFDTTPIEKLIQDEFSTNPRA